jgi:hypothetical protein
MELMVGMRSTNVQVLKTIYIITKEGDSFMPCTALPTSAKYVNKSSHEDYLL